MNRYGFSRRQFGRGVLGAGLVGLPGVVYFGGDEDATGGGGFSGSDYSRSRYAGGGRSAQSKDAGDGGGSGSRRGSAAEVVARFSGDAMRIAQKLAEVETDNFKLREDKRRLNETVAGLKGSAPGEGEVVLSAKDAKVWEALQGARCAEDVQRSLESGRDAIAEREERQREQILAEAAREAGLKPGLLKIVAKGLDIQMRDGEADGDGKRAVVVVRDGEDVMEKPLREYLAEDVVGPLEASEGDGGQMQSVESGVVYPVQGAGSPPAKTNFAVLSSSRYEHNAARRS